MIKKLTKKRKQIIIDGVISIIIIGGLIWMLIDYDRFLNPDFMPSGKAAKIMIIITNLLDRIGGKLFTVLVFTILSMPFIYRALTGLIKYSEDVDFVERKISLSVNDKFKYGNYKVYVKEITSSEKGFSGKGWVEMGIVNKVKKPVEFSNIELNEDFISIKGDLRFLDDE